MNRTDAIAWLVSACAVSLRQSQAKTLTALVHAALFTPRISLANLGRHLRGQAKVKHRIKRVWRFIANDRVEPSVAMTPVVERLLARHPKRRPLGVSFDWTDIRGLQTLVAAANVKGRAIPLCWASCHKHVYDGHRSRNAFEESLLLMLRQMIPDHVKVVILADRGFGRTELGRFCQRRGFSYVIRIQGKVRVKFNDADVRLDHYPVRKGTSERLDNVIYRSRSREPLHQHVVIRWAKGLPKRRDEPWYLMTDLPREEGWTALRTSKLYGQRMDIEQLFRDGKNKRHGWSLRDTGIDRPDRLDRLILVLALAYLLLMGVGLIATERYDPSHWSSNRRSDSASLFTVGQWMLDTIGLRGLIPAVQRQLAQQVPNWG
jgi:hypothetical protein